MMPSKQDFCEFQKDGFVPVQAQLIRASSVVVHKTHVVEESDS
jgi:hypothetical protein